MVTSGELLDQRRKHKVTEWTLWTRPRRWITFTAITVGTTLALATSAVLTVPVTGRQLQSFLFLAVLAIIQTEVSRRVERQRRILATGGHINMTSVWLLPGGLLLPPQLATLLGATLYIYLAFRSWSGIQSGQAHRVAANAATMILSSCAAGFTAHTMAADAVTSVCAAAVVFFVTNAVLTTVGLYLADTKNATLKSCLGTVDDNLLELSTLCVGGLVVAVLPDQPLLSVLVILPLLVLQRSALVKQLEELATTDQKTQLLNAVTWQTGAEREISRVKREGGSFGALMIDLDFFKRINDNYGHLAGDDVLKAVAALVKSETRAHDLAGRFGGEEFVALLASSSKDEAILTAERIRQLVSELVIHTLNNEGEAVVIEKQTASIGVASFPHDGSTLDEVMASADAAVYAAKRNGRNRVVGSPALHEVVPAAA
jgi:diguanylate cyclase (GGDEF)-like protein